ncbi:MAG: hypothetical protein IBJ11_10395 [Phycisphaerales bacterium]|nr:hypothetical protein [Phycisphaerales bacterium]
MGRRVVITGLGAVSGLGLGARALWEGLCAGRSALARVRGLDASGFRCRVAAELPEFSVKDHVPKSYRKAVKVMARDTELAVGAAKAAVEDAGLVTKGSLADDSPDPVTYPPGRFGCQIGAGLIAAEIPELTAAMANAAGPGHALDLARWGSVGMDTLTPLWLLKYLPNMLSCHVTIIHDARGPSNTITCSEASGLLSLGESSRVIERGDADACFSGGAEAKVNHMGIMRLDLNGRLARTEGSPDEESTPWRLVRPFDPGSPGGLLGEGGGIVILEELAAAEKRGARAYAEVLGFGAGHSPMRGTPVEKSEGLAIAVEAALSDAGVTPGEIDAIVPRGSGVPDEDAKEAEALRRVFGPRLAGVPLMTLTPMVGDTYAGQGGLGVCVAAMALREQRLPARLHGGAPAPGLAAGAWPGGPARLQRVLVCTGSLAGQNAAVVLGR